MSKLENKIEANNQSILQVLDNKKYTVDYFQREYSWQQKHIEQLITDLTSVFLAEYQPEHDRSEVENYNNYYLGPFVLSEKNGSRSIIDGQQRLTSLTLLMIYLNNLQKEYGINEKIETLIFSEKFGKQSFNIHVEERTSCLEGLLNHGVYTPKDNDDESTRNMAERYEDIEASFPKEDLDAQKLPFFIDWLKECVVLVEIIAYSDDNAYTIFETMNDRGLNLTATEMLKGYILSRFKHQKQREKANASWKTAIQALHRYDKDEDQRFLQAWLRGKYAESIRPGSAGSKNEDFEKIGTRFHSWFRENLDLINLSADSHEDFVQFMDQEFVFFHRAYLQILDAKAQLKPELENVYYIQHWGIADSLSYPLMLASLKPTDASETVTQKINLVAKYIEIFVVRRALNFKKFAASSIRYTMYTLVKEIRNCSLSELHDILNSKLNDMEQGWDGIANFRLHSQNKRFVKFFLSRVSAFVAQSSGVGHNFVYYHNNTLGKPYEVEHIWANHFERHTDEFSQEHEFDEFRNRLGGLVLLPKGTNQSYGDKPYSDKITHYIKENLLVQSLCELTYQNNPNFLRFKEKYNLPFEAHLAFKKADIIKRQALYRALCELIWSFEPLHSQVQSEFSAM